MLYRNSIFLMHGLRFRLLAVEAEINRAWVIELDKKTSKTRCIRWNEILDLDNLAAEDSSDVAALEATPASIAVRDEALRMLGSLIQNTPAIYDNKMRGRLIAEQAASVGCSKSVLYKHLINYLQGGQTPSALLGRFNRCGKERSLTRVVCGPAKTGGEAKYLLKEKDLEVFKSEITNVYLKDLRISIAATYKRLLQKHYRMVDGNGDSYLAPMGEYPTIRQFEYYLRKHYPQHVRRRARHGDKAYELEHRAILGTTLADCEGVGHYYEADATIADVYLRASDDISKIVGKPTLYLITDRKSRLIVGWYVGLENASWVCAMQAMVSISQDKSAICRRLDIPYDPDDWPADGVFPQSVLVDRGEWTAKESTQIADGMATDVVYVPAKRADWKPIAESRFKLMRVEMQDGVPGMDPPENAKKRQGIKYEQDACLTLQEFERIIVLIIIKHNRSPNRKYRLSLKELEDQVSPDPISLWNHGIRERTGLLNRYSEAFVRRTLLAQTSATISERGIAVHGCYYTCNEALEAGWFERARTRKFQARVSFDRRLVNVLFVHDPFKSGRVYECKLTSVSQDYSGMSVAEVFAIEKFRKARNSELEHRKLGIAVSHKEMTDETVTTAKKKLKSAKLKTSRTAARADIKADRARELSAERQSLIEPATSIPGPKTSADVISLNQQRIGNPAQKSNDAVAAANDHIADPFKQVRERLLNGKL